MRVLIIGMGGFAGRHHQAVEKLEKTTPVKLVATCDPMASTREEGREKFSLDERGVHIFTDYREMLAAYAGEALLVVIPTPINLHREMHEAAVRAGFPVYLEKPPTLNHEELESMLEVEKTARKKTMVGFNFIVEELRQKLKQRLLDGEFGPLESISFHGFWPRARQYFTRNNWGGRLMVNDRLVVDSAMGNAMSHFVHNILFWADTESLFSWPRPETVHAELYRAHSIESTDTLFVSMSARGIPPIRIFFTHACSGAMEQKEIIACARATIVYDVYGEVTVEWKDGRREHFTPGQSLFVEENYLAYRDYLEDRAERPPTTLADTRAFVELYNLTFLAAGRITTVDHPHLTLQQRIPKGETEPVEYVAINEIASIARQFLLTGQMPSAQDIPWAVPGGKATRADLPQFSAVIRDMYQPQPA